MKTRSKTRQFLQRFFKGHTQEEAVFFLFTVLISLVAGYYSFANHLYGVSLPYVAVQAIAVVALVVNGLAYRWHRNLKMASLLLSVPTAIVLLTSVFHGGVDGSGIYWVFGFPAAVFLFLGIRLGHAVNTVFISAMVAIAVLQHVGFVSTRYSNYQLREGIVVLVVLTILAVVSQFARDRLQRQLKRQQNRISIILEQLPAGVVLAELPKGIISVANPAASELLGQEFKTGISLEECAKTHNLRKATGELYPFSELPLYVALNEGKGVEVSEVVVVRPDGVKTVLDCSAAPIRDSAGNVIAAVAVFVDKTKEFNLKQMKSELVSLVSHQLKAPITSLQWTIESMAAGDMGEVSEGQGEALGSMNEILRRLKILVGDMLNVSRIETGRKFDIVKRPTDLAELVRKIVREHSEAASRRGVTVDDSALPKEFLFEVDESKMHEVFANLIGNAVKYSKEGGRVEVGVLDQQVDGSEVLFVRDDGIGIPKDVQSQIFERFYRAPNVPHDTEGTGLGLYIAKAIVEKHGGQLWFESEEGKGTTFFVRLEV